MEVGPQPEVRVEQLGLGDDVEGAPHGEHEIDRAERFEAAADPRSRAPDALGNDPQLAEMGGQDGEDPVGLAEVQPAEDDGLGLVQARARAHRQPVGYASDVDIRVEFSQMVADVDAEMRSILDEHRGPADPLYEMLAYHLGLDGSDGSTGKRIRPCSASSSSAPLAATTGARCPAAEMGHNFSLVHDDIQDGDRERGTGPRCGRCGHSAGDQRRRRPVRAVAARALPARGRRERPRGPEPRQVLELMRIYDQTCLSLCEGQFLDISFEGRLDVTVEEYLQMIELKTAALMAAGVEARPPSAPTIPRWSPASAASATAWASRSRWPTT